MHAARAGNTKPLLRLYDLDTKASSTTALDLSAGLFAATVCRDGPFPWPSDSSPAVRAGLLAQALAAMPAGSFGPFGSYAAKLGNADLCVDWPTPTGNAALQSTPYPDVPMLALSGGFDMRTPTAGAASVVAQFPQGHLVVVPGVGHSVVTADPSGCALLAVRNWILNATVPASTCARPKFIVAPLAPYPAATTPRHLGPAATYAIVSKTLREAEAGWLLVDSARALPLRRRALEREARSRRQLRVQARRVRHRAGRDDQRARSHLEGQRPAAHVRRHDHRAAAHPRPPACSGSSGRA